MGNGGKAVVCPINTATSFGGAGVKLFLPTVSGTITITHPTATAGTITLLNAFPVTAGVWVDLCMYVSHFGGTLTTAGGAAGTLVTY